MARPKSERKRKEAEYPWHRYQNRKENKYLGRNLGNQTGTSRYAMELKDNWFAQPRALSVTLTLVLAIYPLHSSHPRRLPLSLKQTFSLMWQNSYSKRGFLPIAYSGIP